MLVIGPALRTVAAAIVLSAVVLLTPAVAQSVELTSSDLPILLIDTDGAYIPDEPKIAGWMSAIDNGPGRRNQITDPPTAYDGHIGIEMRGSSSLALFDKKSYAVETRLPDGSNNNVALLGLPVENDWVLHGPYSDKTLIRNALTYELYRRMGRYASRSRFCEIVINGRYMGVYVLLERVKRDNDRIDISRIHTDDNSGDSLTGGYIIKIDKLEGAEVGGWYSDFPTMTDPSRRTYYQFHYPQPSDITNEQAAYIRDFVRRFEEAAASPTFTHPSRGYASLLDRSSAVDYMLISELTNNVDAYRLSTFLYKDRDSAGGKLVTGPPWDYNIALGNADYYDGWERHGFRVRYPLTTRDAFHGPFWWRRILDDPGFTGELVSRWEDLRSSTLSTPQILSLIDSLSAHITEAQQRNFVRWPVLSEYVWPNAVVRGSHAAEVDYLKSWMKDRLDWLDASIGTIGGEATSEEPTPDPATEVLSAVYPNPASNHILFSVSLSSSQRVTISLRDAAGRTVRTIASQFLGNDAVHRYSIDVRGLASGVYLLQLAGEREAEARKVAVIRD